MFDFDLLRICSKTVTGCVPTSKDASKESRDLVDSAMLSVAATYGLNTLQKT